MKIQEIISYITGLKELKNKDIKALSYFGFFISLFPVPGTQQCGMIIDRLSNDEIIKREFEEIKNIIDSQNDRIKSLENLPQGIEEIAGTVKYNKYINQKVEELVNKLLSSESGNSKWKMETTNWSYQSMLNSIVQADEVQIISTANSSNSIANSKIESINTHLFSDGSSSNYVDRTTFSGNGGQVKMDGITTSGNINVSGSSIGFGNGGGIFFGGNPNIISGNCPKCNYKISVDKFQVKKYEKIQCPNCKEIFPYSIG